jgi:hypothetical protein
MKLYSYQQRNTFLPRTQQQPQQKMNIDIQIVISRYNEDLEWVKEEPFRKYPFVCYNKGINNDFYQPDNMKVINLENVGRCDHTYLYHITQNYENLGGITIFLPGSTDFIQKKRKAIQLIHEVEKLQNSVFIGEFNNDVVKKIYDFSLDEYIGFNKNNQSINSESKLLPASIRPFGKWYESKFKDLKIQFISWWSILGISKNHITQHPKSYYEDFMQELSTHSNPEVGHYIERSWNAIFYPLAGAKFIFQ